MIRTYAAILLLSPAFLFGVESSLTSKDVAAVQDVDRAYVQAVRAADWKSLAALLTENVVVMPPNESAVVGRQANLARFQAFKFASVEYTHSPGYIAGSGRVAYLQGTYTIRMNIGGSAPPFEDQGKYLWVLKKQRRGTWLIELWLAADAVPFTGPELPRLVRSSMLAPWLRVVKVPRR